MKTKIIFLSIFLVLVSCKKNEATSTAGNNESNDIAISDTISSSMDSAKATSDSSVVSETVEAIESTSNFQKLRTKIKSDPNLFELENLNNSKIKSENTEIALPDDFIKSDFVRNTGTGLEIEKIIGNIVKVKATENNISIYENAGITVLKPNLNLKPTAEKESIFYEHNFNSGYTAALNAIVGGISVDKKYAYSMQLSKLYNIQINQKDLDQEELKNLVKNKSFVELKEYYVLVGVTNWFFRIAQYEESNLKGNFSYAINIDGKKYANTSYKKTEYKIAVNAQPLSNFIKITK